MKTRTMVLGMLAVLAVTASCEKRVVDDDLYLGYALFEADIVKSDGVSPGLFGKSVWNSGDRVSVYGPESDAPAVYDIADAGKTKSAMRSRSGFIYWKKPRAHSFYGFYPSAEQDQAIIGTGLHNSLATVIVPANQTPDKITVETGNLVARPSESIKYMYASQSNGFTNLNDTVPLLFHPLVTMLELDICNTRSDKEPMDLVKIVLSSRTHALNGTFISDLATLCLSCGGYPACALKDTTSESNLSIQMPLGTESNPCRIEAEQYLSVAFACVPLDDLNDLRFDLYYADGDIKSLPLRKPQSAGGEYYVFPRFRFSRAECKLSENVAIITIDPKNNE